MQEPHELEDQKVKSYDALKTPIREYVNRKWPAWKANNLEPTHLLLDGGKLHIPMSENNRFISLLGANLDNGIQNFVTERRTPVFMMHADLDILESPENQMTLELFAGWAKEIQSVIKDFFEPADNRWGIKDKTTRRSFDRLSMLVCCAPQKEHVEKANQLWTKTGMHLIWPWLKVTTKEAMTIRRAWIQHFEKKFGVRGSHNKWEEVFDLCVYQGNGLRMVGSDKIEKCPTCKGKASPNQFCPSSLCDGKSGKYAQNRVYRVVDAYDGRKGRHYPKLVEAATVNGFTEIKLTSIRTKATRSTEMRGQPEWFDRMFFYDEPENHKRIFKPTPGERKKKREALAMMPDNVKGAEELGITNAPKISCEDKRFGLLQKWLRNDNLEGESRLPDVYRNTEIVDLVHKVGSDGSSYFLARTDSAFCMNKSGEHNNNNIYFCITKKGLFQKCFCRCPTKEGRKHGKCSEYTSSPYLMPPYVLEVFFPDLHATLRRAHTIIMENADMTWSGELPFEQQMAINNARYENLAVRMAQCRAERKARYEKRFNAK